MTELERGFENRVDVDVADLRAQAYLFIASAYLGMFQRQMGVASVAVIGSVATNVIKIKIPKNGGHFKRRAAIGRRNNCITTTSRRSKQVPACVSNIDYTR